ncbi:MAG TPA: class I SAM-dependent methyltransferase [Chryseolinea sp.]|nr:class I SAM-dependent methyltransferase [Chryseolinea sp.]
MVFERLRQRIEVTDAEFNAIYPTAIRKQSENHWTPIAVAKAASRFLVTSRDTRVLDIGSGSGKFCLIGATHTDGHFTGVEQRLELAELTTELAHAYNLFNVKCIHGNIASITFSDYDAFYFFNSFHENIDVTNKVDDTVRVDIKFYEVYTAYMVEQLIRLPAGTRLATYYTPATIIPRCFQRVDTLYQGQLHFWEKVV